MYCGCRIRFNVCGELFAVSVCVVKRWFAVRLFPSSCRLWLWLWRSSSVLGPEGGGRSVPSGLVEQCAPFTLNVDRGLRAVRENGVL